VLDFRKLEVHYLGAGAEAREPLAAAGDGERIAIERDHPHLARSLEQRLGVTAGAGRGIDEDVSTARGERRHHLARHDGDVALALFFDQSERRFGHMRINSLTSSRI
jgi:hypothetical protein